MKTFVLVHGAWQGSSAWSFVKEILEQHGYAAITVQLPGRDAAADHFATLSIGSYRDAVIDTINEFAEPVILVGHSMAGMVITAVAEAIPDQIEKLVYLNGFVPKSGDSLATMREHDQHSLVNSNFILSEDQLSSDFSKEKIIDIFYHDVPAALHNLILSRHLPEPFAPFLSPVHHSPDNYGKVAKFYIHGLYDRAITIDFQKQMVQAAAIKDVYTLESAHSPYLSHPTELSDILMEIAVS